MLELYTDGSASTETRLGGWAVISSCGLAISDKESNTTSQRMELTAAIEAVKLIKEGELAVIHSDSQYVIMGITVWAFSWISQNWRDGAIKNRDLWETLLEVSKGRTIKWVKVKAHSGDKYNEIADVAAREAYN